MNPLKKNYFIALLDSEQPDFHMTVKYYKNLSPDKLHDLMHDVVNKCGDKPKQFEICFDEENFFGHRGGTRVLTPEDFTAFPRFLDDLHNPNGWNPHISTEERDVIHMNFDTIAIMHKNQIVCAWEMLDE